MTKEEFIYHSFIAIVAKDGERGDLGCCVWKLPSDAEEFYGDIIVGERMERLSWLYDRIAERMDVYRNDDSGEDELLSK